MKQIFRIDFWTRKREIYVTLTLLAILLGFQFFTLATSARNFYSTAEINVFATPTPKNIAMPAVENSAIYEFSVQVGQINTLHWYREDPFQFPNTVEYCTASTNPSYVQISLYPTGPFSSAIVNVPFPSDAGGFGRTPTIYYKGIAVTNNQVINLSCPYSTPIPALIDVTPISTPTPTPTATPVEPQVYIRIVNSDLNKISVGETRQAHIEVRNGKPNYQGNIKVFVSSDNSTNPPSPSFFGLNSNNSEPPQASIFMPIQLDSSGFGTTALFRIRGLKSSQYSQTIFAKYDDGIKTDTDSEHLHIFHIEQIWFERDTGQVPIDNNPHVGGGLRVFPEKKTPNDMSFGRNKVLVKVRLSRPLSGVKIAFKIFDVDDPEFVSHLDPNGAVYVDFTGTHGNDNRGLTSLYPLGLQGITNSEGVASMYVQVSPQPGDNIRVGATAKGDPIFGINNYLDEIQFDDTNITLPSGEISPVGMNLKDNYGYLLTDTGNIRAAGVATKMLTTWRRLHLEVDSMGTVVNNFLSAKITNTTSVPFGIGTIITIDKTADNNRFQGGRLEILKNGITTSYKIASSSRASINVTANLTDDLIGATVKIFDDDDMNGNDAAKLDGDNGEDVPSPNLGYLQDTDHFLNNSLMIVYIRPTYDLTGNETDLPFFLNTPKADLTAFDSTIAEKQIMTNFNNDATRKDAEFWTGYIFGAYQIYTQGDQDPNDDSDINNVDAYLGETSEDFGAICYLESVSESTDHKILQFSDPDYDVFFDWRETPLHEVFHLLRADDGDGGQIDNQFRGLSGISQNKIRRSRVPFMADVP